MFYLLVWRKGPRINGLLEVFVSIAFFFIIISVIVIVINS